MKWLLHKTYMSVLRGSAGSLMFRSSYSEVDGKEVDILQEGELSCAFFVSFMLHAFGLISDMHATVSGTLRDMEKSGWQKIEALKEGCVISWEPIDCKSGVHGHLGFYLGDDLAISHTDSDKAPAIHHFTYGIPSGVPARKIIGAYWHPKLGS